MTRLSLLSISVVLAAASPARAAVDQAIAGVRSYAMGGAHRGLGTSNDTLQLNPAGMAVVKRYAVEITYGYTEPDALNQLGVSAVDSKSGPVAGGLALTHVGGGLVTGGLNHLYVGAAYLISDAIALGLSLHHIRGGYDDFAGGNVQTSLFTGDLGLMVLLTEGISVGFSYNNVVETDDPLITPPTLGWGAGLTFSALTLAYDMTLGVGTGKDFGMSYHAGAEYFLLEQFPLRAGFVREKVQESDGAFAYRNYVSGGIGYTTMGGSLEVAYRQAPGHSSDWGIVGALKLFL